MKLPARIFFAFLALLSLLSACGPATTPAEAIPARTATPRFTYTHRPTTTDDPTHTPSIAQETWVAGSHAEQTTTQSAQETAIGQFPYTCDPPEMVGYIVSPDGNWLASGCYGQENVFIVSNRNGSAYWSIPGGNEVGQIPGDGYCMGIPIHWSNDSSNVYFHLHDCYEPSIMQIHWYRIDQVPDELFVMNTLTGLWYKLTPSANLFSFSPTGRRLLYISIAYAELDYEPSAIDVTVLDLQTGESVRYSLTDYLVASYIVWSDDGTKAFLSAERGAPVYLSDDPHTYSIYMIDMISQTMTNLYTFEDSETIIYTADYLDETNTLVLYSGSSDRPEAESRFLDLNSSEILEEQPTRTP